jgi:hypothetical protein
LTPSGASLRCRSGAADARARAERRNGALTWPIRTFHLVAGGRGTCSPPEAVGPQAATDEIQVGRSSPWS